MTNDERIAKAQRAKAIIEDPLMAEAAAHIEAECWRLFKSFAPTDTEGLAQVKAIQYMHDKYQAFLKRAIADGTMAKLDVERKRPRPLGY